MRVLLIYPYWTAAKPGLWISLGLCFIGALLTEQGHTVSVFDRTAKHFGCGNNRLKLNQLMLDHVEDFQPDLIGLNTVSPVIYDTVECVELIRTVWAGPMIAGGHHATALPELTLSRIKGLSGVISGEGEIAMAKLAAGQTPETIPGIWWRRNDHFVHTPAEQINDLDQLPLPALDLVDMDFYTKRSVYSINGCYRSVLCMLTSRGCYNKCSFCSESLTYGKSVRFHSPEYVVAGIKKYIRDYPTVDAICFHDNDFLADPDRAGIICEKVLAAGLNKKIGFVIQTRTDRITPEILKHLKKAGCFKIEFGIETATKKQLDRIKKNNTEKTNTRAVQLCRQAGIPAHAYMLTGLENETIADLNAQLRWIKKTKPTTVQLSRINIHPGTLLYQDYGDSFFERNDWTESNVNQFYQTRLPTRISAQSRQAWMKRAFPHLILNNFKAIIKLNPPRYWKDLLPGRGSYFYRALASRIAKWLGVKVIDKQ